MVTSSKCKKKINKINSNENDTTSKIINVYIAKITKNLENFNYNVIIANYYEIYNILLKEVNKNHNGKNFRENYIKILKMFMPVIPHFSSQCLEELEPKKNYSWPSFSKNSLNFENHKIVIQINGKKRSIIEIQEELKEKELIEIIYKNKTLQKYLNGQKVKRSIYVKNRLINLII